MLRELKSAPPFGMGFYYLICDEVRLAAEWFSMAVEFREPFAIMYARSPFTRILRESDRWAAIESTMKLATLDALKHSTLPHEDVPRQAARNPLSLPVCRVANAYWPTRVAFSDCPVTSNSRAFAHKLQRCTSCWMNYI